MGIVSATTLFAETKQDFPAHWGKRPEIQTRDYIELPAGYGHGSSTLRNWISANLQKDQADAGDAKSAAVTTLYTNDFAKAVVGGVPDDLMVLGGEFTVKSEGADQFLELPGDVGQFCRAVWAGGERWCGHQRADFWNEQRPAPTFGVGLGGVSGWKLQVWPGREGR